MTDGETAGSSTTGDPRVDAALALLQGLDGRDLAEQLDVFTDLQAALAGILDDPEGVGVDSAAQVGDSPPRSPAP